MVGSVLVTVAYILHSDLDVEEHVDVTSILSIKSPRGGGGGGCTAEKQLICVAAATADDDDEVHDGAVSYCGRCCARQGRRRPYLAAKVSYLPVPPWMNG